MKRGDLVKLKEMAFAYMSTSTEEEYEHRYGILISEEQWKMDDVGKKREQIWKVFVKGQIQEIFETDLTPIKIEQIKNL